MITQPDLDKLAKSLTAAQRVFVLSGEGCVRGYRPGERCAELGLGEFVERRYGGERFVWLPLGLALRNHLKQQESADGR